jgi:TRAP-type C4-dicarboxylate transport system substrate-binding protein
VACILLPFLQATGKKKGLHMLKRMLTGLALAVATATGAVAQDLPKSQFKVVGLNSPTPVSIHDELPFWRKTIPEASKGAITVDVTPLDQMGIDDKTMLRLLKLGVMDFAAMDISKMAGDDPRFEACDLAGLTLDPDKARTACNAYRSVIDRQMQKNWNAKLLAFGGNTPQVFWCRDVISGLDGFKGKKIRVFNNTMRDFLGGVGGTAGEAGRGRNAQEAGRGCRAGRLGQALRRRMRQGVECDGRHVAWPEGADAIGRRSFR